VPARTLSGGMKRRLMIARAMVHQPRLLILDEPTAGVDIEIRRAMWKYLEDINRAGTTVILTTHYLEEAEKLCRTIAIIDRGRIIEHTTMRKLIGKLDVEGFVLDIGESDAALPELPGVRLSRIDANTLEAEMSRTHDLNSVFAALTAHGITVISMRNKANRLEELKQTQGIGFCNITMCCTKVCPEGITITDNAIIPLKERVVDQYFDPIAKLLRWLRSSSNGERSQ